MKKLFLVAAFVLSSVASFAQQAAGTFTLQPKVGLNVASMTELDGSDPRIGLAVGAEGQYQFSDLVGVSFGLLYSQQGATGALNAVEVYRLAMTINSCLHRAVHLERRLDTELNGETLVEIYVGEDRFLP